MKPYSYGIIIRPKYIRYMWLYEKDFLASGVKNVCDDDLVWELQYMFRDVYLQKFLYL